MPPVADDRWWEGRCSWGKIIAASWSLVQQASANFPRLHGPEGQADADNAVALMARLVIICAYTIKNRLSDSPLDADELAGVIDPEWLQYLAEMDVPSVPIHMIEQVLLTFT